MMISDETIEIMLSHVENGELDKAEKLLDKHTGLVSVDTGMGTWLHNAAAENDLEMAAMLLEKGCDLKATYCVGKHQLSALDTAISSDAPEVVEFLLLAGADSSNQRCVLSAIVGKKRRSLEIIKVLETHGADLNAVFDNENTGEKINALSHAIAYERHDVVAYLKSRGCVLPGEARSLHAESQSQNPAVSFFESQYGAVAPRSLIEVVSDIPEIIVHAIPANDQTPCLTLFTAGMSVLAMNVPESQDRFARAELFIQLPADWAYEKIEDVHFGWPVHWLRALAKYPHQNQTWLGGEVAIVDEDVFGFNIGSGFDSMLVLCEKEYATCDGSLVSVYRLFPLCTSERHLEKTEGVGSLMRAFDANDVSFVVDMKRKSVT